MKYNLYCINLKNKGVRYLNLGLYTELRMLMYREKFNFMG